MLSFFHGRRAERSEGHREFHGRIRGNARTACRRARLTGGKGEQGRQEMADIDENAIALLVRIMIPGGEDLGADDEAREVTAAACPWLSRYAAATSTLRTSCA